MRLVLCGILLAAGFGIACAPVGTAGDCRSAAAPVAAGLDAAHKPKPRPGKSAERKSSGCTKANSPVWQELRPYRGSIRTNGRSGTAQRFYEWDSTHGDIEVYDHNGRHLGSMDAASGRMTKPAVKSRTLRGLR